MDYRDRVRAMGRGFDFDEARMKATIVVWLPDELGDEVERVVEVPCQYAMCPTCDGKGKHVDPGVDSHGISGEEFLMDYEFEEDYRSGAYDVTCFECHGRRVVPIFMPDTDNKELMQAITAWEEARGEEARDLAEQERWQW